MVYTPLIQKAISFSLKVHELDQKQKRKGKDVPYIVHPLTVGLILSRVTKEENSIVAGILHDTIEDCFPYGTVTKEILTEQFNEDVARMVNDVTEQDKTLPWMERKMEALEHIATMQKDSILVKSADVLQNLSEVNDDLEKEGIGFLKNFSTTTENTIARYQKLIDKLTLVWPENPLLADLQQGLSKLLSLTN